MRDDLGEGAMPRVGNVLVQLEAGMPSAAVRSYVVELRDRLGSSVHLDLHGPAEIAGGLPDGVRLLGRGAAARALAAAGRAARDGHLVVLLRPLLPEDAAIQGLLGAFRLDPLVGFAQPRFADATGDGIWSLPGGFEAAGTLLHRAVLSLLPDHHLTGEHLAACIAMSREVVAGLTPSSESADDLPAVLLREMCRARRRGYRSLVMNRVVVPSSEPRTSLYPALEPASNDGSHVDSPGAWDEAFTGDAHRRFERLAAVARRARPTDTIPVLLDCRGAQAFHNGTSQAIHGLLDGLSEDRPRWDIDLLFDPKAARYHDVARRHPSMRVVTTMPDRFYGAAVRLDQPFQLSAIAELHRRGAAISFNMLDAIAWDVVYLSGPEVGRAWRFIAAHADGLSYISSFSRQRFNFRFPVMQHVVQAVTHLSLERDENRDPALPALADGDHILVFGNHYDHKAVAPTIALLSGAFPYERIRGVGGKPDKTHNASTIQSGHAPAAEIERLIATARMVIFPSHYEGFGLPVVKALAYGRLVVVRSSPLWREIAGLMQMPGRLVEFVAHHELVEIVGKALAGEPLETMALGADLPAEARPPRWSDCARRLVGLVEETASRVDFRRWYAREQALSLSRV